MRFFIVSCAKIDNFFDISKLSIKKYNKRAISPRDLCFIGEKVRGARQASKDVGVNVEGDLEA